MEINLTNDSVDLIRLCDSTRENAEASLRIVDTYIKSRFPDFYADNSISILRKLLSSLAKASEYTEEDEPDFDLVLTKFPEFESKFANFYPYEDLNKIELLNLAESIFFQKLKKLDIVAKIEFYEEDVDHLDQVEYFVESRDS